jgi:hypoxanthine-DNA glycosylase
LWDVLQACFRSGSLDAAIDDRTLVTNDFPSFFDAHPRIRRVFFNGAKAEAVYRRHVLPLLPEPAAALPLLRLPSTSPAHAGMTLRQKVAAWRAIADSL